MAAGYSVFHVLPEFWPEGESEVMAMGNGNFICYVCNEDLTDKVLSAKSDDIAAQVRVFEAKKEPSERARWRIVVECSKGHKNVFQGED